MVTPTTSAEPMPARVRKTLVQQQGEVTVKDPPTHAARQVRELDKVASKIAEKQRTCREQIERDREELASIDNQIGTESRRYNAVLESLRFRRRERDRVRKHLAMCSEKNKALLGEVHSKMGWVRREDSLILKSLSSMELEAAKGFGSGPGTTFSRKRARGSSPSGSAQTLPPLRGRGGGSGNLSHSISAPALRK